MKPTLESRMRDWIIRLETAERPDGSVYVTSPTFPLFRIVIPKTANVAETAFSLLKEYMQLNTNRDFQLLAAAEASALFDGKHEPRHIPAYVIAQAAA